MFSINAGRYSSLREMDEVICETADTVHLSPFNAIFLFYFFCLCLYLKQS